MPSKLRSALTVGGFGAAFIACSARPPDLGSLNQANIVTHTVGLRGTPNGLAIDNGAGAVAEADANLVEEAAQTAGTYSVNTVLLMGHGPLFVAAGPSQVATSDSTDNRVSIFLGNAMPPRVDQAAAGHSPQGLVYVGFNLYVVNQGDNNVTVISTGSNAYPTIATIPVGNGASRIARFGTKTIFVSNTSDGTVSVIDVGTNKNIGTITLGAGSEPQGLAVDAVSHRLYVALQGQDVVAAIDADNPTAGPLFTLPTDPQPMGLAVNSVDDEVFVSSIANSTITIFDGAFNTKVNTVPVGSNPVDVAVDPVSGDVWSSNKGDKTLTVFTDPGNDTRVIKVPVRLCATSDSQEAASPGTMLSELNQAVDAVWLASGAHVLFQSVPIERIPIIPLCLPAGAQCFCPPNSKTPVACPSVFFPSASYDNLNTPELTGDCELLWQQANPRAVGIPVVSVKDFADGTAGTATGATLSMVVSTTGAPSSRTNDLCVHPRRITMSDVQMNSGAVQKDWNQYFGQIGGGRSTFAHELGHTLMLGHGNGLDDDRNGTFPPNPGYRDYDSYCDSKGFDPMSQIPVEDVPGPCPQFSSVMVEGGSCEFLQELQIEQSQEIASVAPGHSGGAADPSGALLNNAGCSAPPCGLPGEIYLEKLGIAENVSPATTGFALRVFSPVSNTLNAQYAIVADLDNDATTGCAASDAGIAVAFQGAELATVVEVTPGVQPSVAVQVWKCAGGAFMQVTDPAISATATSSFMSETPNSLLKGIITANVPNGVRGAMSSEIRAVAISSQLISGGAFDQLPRTSASGGAVPLSPPDLPSCSLKKTNEEPGAQDIVMATGLSPSAPVEVALAGRVLQTGTTDASGTATVTFTVPANARPGLRLVTVGHSGTAIYAACALRVGTEPLTPSTTATITPSPNVDGWNRTDVVVSLIATPAFGGAPIQSITYSTSGAQSLSSTVAGASASFSLTQEGTTTGVFHAIDTSGVQELPEPLLVKIDKTPPTIVYSGNQGAYTIDQSVSITCSVTDNLSGVFSANCAPISGPAYSFNVGPNTFSATATDFAGNVATATTTFNVQVTFDGLCRLIEQFVSGGIGNSLCAKLDAAALDAMRGDVNAKSGVLGAFRNEVNAQISKSLTPAQAALLLKLVGYL
jgi:YVTN family beta-propeller protein